MKYCADHKRFCNHKPTDGIFFITDRKEKSANIISGFLGAGKTTTVNNMLSQPCDKKIDIVVREYGEIAVDDRLIDIDKERLHIFFGASMHADPQTMLYNYLEGLYDRSDRHPFDHLLIETSGAESAESMVQMFFLPSFREHYHLGAFITVVDGEYGLLNLRQFRVAREQVAFADVVVINKLDLADEAELAELTRQIKTINPYASIIRASYGAVNLREVMETDMYEQLCSVDPSAFEVKGELEAVDEFNSISISVKETLDFDMVNSWIVDVFEKYGASILRGKGFFNIAGSDYRFDFQSVRKTFHSKTDNIWGDNEERRSVIVFIGTNLPPRDSLQAGLEACTKY